MSFSISNEKREVSGSEERRSGKEGSEVIAVAPSDVKRLRAERGGSRSPITVCVKAPCGREEVGVREAPASSTSASALSGCVSDGGRRGSCSSSERMRIAWALIRRAAL